MQTFESRADKFQIFSKTLWIARRWGIDYAAEPKTWAFLPPSL